VPFDFSLKSKQIVDVAGEGSAMPSPTKFDFEGGCAKSLVFCRLDTFNKAGGDSFGTFKWIEFPPVAIMPKYLGTLIAAGVIRWDPSTSVHGGDGQSAAAMVWW